MTCAMARRIEGKQAALGGAAQVAEAIIYIETDLPALEVMDVTIIANCVACGRPKTFCRWRCHVPDSNARPELLMQYSNLPTRSPLPRRSFRVNG